MLLFLKDKYLPYFFEYDSFCEMNKRKNYYALVQLTTRLLYNTALFADILFRLESISQRIDDIQCFLIKNNDEDSSLDLDISEIDF